MIDAFFDHHERLGARRPPAIAPAAAREHWEPAGPAEIAVDHDERSTGVSAGPQQGAGATPPAESATTRSQNVVYTLPHDWGTIPQFLGGALERLDADATGTQLLIVTPDAETALAIADAALTLRDGAAREGRSPVLAVTRVERAVRQLRARPSAAIAGDAAAIGALLRASALKLDAVRTFVLAWADEILESPHAGELDVVLTELPKESARTLVASRMTDEVEALIERALWRPRRIGAPASGASALAVSYVATVPSARPTALRRVLDELDPASTVVLVSTDASDAEARRAVRALGYGVAGGDAATPEAEAQRALDGATNTATNTATVQVQRIEAATALPSQPGLVVLYDLPGGREALDRAAASRAAQIVALVQPRQLPALRQLAAGPVKPLTLRDLGRRESAREAALRADLRTELSRGVPPRELRVLEDLLEEYDGLELAAAALRLLERERARRATAAAASPTTSAAPSAGAPGAAGAMTRLFVSVGTRDGVRAGDLVGAISGESGITSDRIGKIEIRESFSLVEIASADAERVVAKVNGIAIKGRKAAVRTERDGGRPERGDRPDRGDRKGPPGRGGPRAGAGPRSGPPMGGERRDAGPRPPRTFDARTDGPRGFGATDDRTVGERAEQRGEWAERAERLQRAKRRAPGQSDAGSPDAGAPDAGSPDTEG